MDNDDSKPRVKPGTMGSQPEIEFQSGPDIRANGTLEEDQLTDGPDIETPTNTGPTRIQRLSHKVTATLKAPFYILRAYLIVILAVATLVGMSVVLAVLLT